jgi:hypothetical protein
VALATMAAKHPHVPPMTLGKLRREKGDSKRE